MNTYSVKLTTCDPLTQKTLTQEVIDIPRMQLLMMQMQGADGLEEQPGILDGLEYDYEMTQFEFHSKEVELTAKQLLVIERDDDKGNTGRHIIVDRDYVRLQLIDYNTKRHPDRKGEIKDWAHQATQGKHSYMFFNIEGFDDLLAYISAPTEDVLTYNA